VPHHSPSKCIPYYLDGAPFPSGNPNLEWHIPVSPVCPILPGLHLPVQSGSASFHLSAPSYLGCRITVPQGMSHHIISGCFPSHMGDPYDPSRFGDVPYYLWMTPLQPPSNLWFSHPSPHGCPIATHLECPTLSGVLSSDPIQSWEPVHQGVAPILGAPLCDPIKADPHPILGGPFPIFGWPNPSPQEGCPIVTHLECPNYLECSPSDPIRSWEPGHPGLLQSWVLLHAIQYQLTPSQSWISIVPSMDWIGLDWIGSDDCKPFLISNHCSTVDAVSLKL